MLMPPDSYLASSLGRRVLNHFGDSWLTKTAPLRSRLGNPCEINATVAEPRP